MRSIAWLALLLPTSALALEDEVFVLPVGQSTSTDVTQAVAIGRSNTIWTASIINGTAENPYYLNSVSNALGTKMVYTWFSNSLSIVRHGNLGVSAPRAFWCGQVTGTVTAMAADGDNIYLVGQFVGTAYLGTDTLTSGGSVDGFIARYNGATGNVVWTQSLRGSGFDTLEDIALDSYGRPYVTGSFNGSATLGGVSMTSAGGDDVVLAMIDPATGVPYWVRTDGGTGNETALAMDLHDGNVYLGGRFTGTTSLAGSSHTSAGSTDGFVSKYTAAGANVRSARLGGSSSDEVAGIAIGGVNEDVIIGGNFRGTTTIGSKSLTSAGNQDFFMAALTDGLVFLGPAHRGGGTGYDRITAVDADVNIAYASGYRHRSGDWGRATLEVPDVDGDGTSGGGYDAFVIGYKERIFPSAFSPTAASGRSSPGSTEARLSRACPRRISTRSSPCSR